MRSLQEQFSAANTARRRIFEKQLRSLAVMSKLDTPQAKASRAGLRALSFKHVYAGTVPAEVVAKRRAANKVARRSRRINRQRAK